MRRAAVVLALVASLSFGAVRPADAGIKHALKKTAHVLVGTLEGIVAVAATIIVCTSTPLCSM